MFNIFTNEIFLFELKVFLSNFADSNIQNIVICTILDQTSKISEKISKWFTESFMILNPYSCHYMCFGKDNVNAILKFCDEELEASILEKSKE